MVGCTLVAYTSKFVRVFKLLDNFTHFASFCIVFIFQTFRKPSNAQDTKKPRLSNILRSRIGLEWAFSKQVTSYASRVSNVPHADWLIIWTRKQKFASKDKQVTLSYALQFTLQPLRHDIQARITVSLPAVKKQRLWGSSAVPWYATDRISASKTLPAMTPIEHSTPRWAGKVL